MSLATTVNDPFNEPVGGQSEPNTAMAPPGTWTPSSSDRTLTFIGVGGTTSINDDFADKWFFSFLNGESGERAQLSYTRTGGGTYDLSALVSITVHDISFSVANTADLTLVLITNETNGDFATQTFTISTTGGDIPFVIADMPTTGAFDPASIEKIIFEVILTNDSEGLISGTAEAITSTSVPICVARDTQVLMADGSQKVIQDIERGDLVAGDGDTVSRVARVLCSELPAIAPVSMISMEPHAIGKNQPHSRLILTSGHPILHDGARRRAKCFRKLEGVKYHGKDKTKAADVLPANADGTHSLYNLQFEHDGYFVANGVVVDSVPVLSPLAVLPKELFFDQELYNKPSIFQVDPLDKTLLKN